MSDDPFVESHCSSIEKRVRSKISASDCNHTWIIEDFSWCNHPLGQCIKSEVFTDLQDDELKWQLLLFPNGLSNEGWLEVCLQNVSRTVKTVFSRVKLSLVNSEEAFHFYRVNRDYCFDERCLRLDFKKFSNRDFMLKRLLKSKEDVLRIRCELRNHRDKPIYSCLREPMESSSLKLARDISALFATGELSDCVLRAQDREFQVHKAVLSCRSPKFYAMFECESYKKNEGVPVYEVKYDPEAVELMLRFVYDGKISICDVDPEIAPDLYEAACEYDFLELKKRCAEFLGLNLTVDNVFKVLRLAKASGDLQLKTSAVRFIKENYGKVAVGQQWRELQLLNCKDVDDAFAEILEHIIASYF